MASSLIKSLCMWAYALRDHRKSSQKPSETNKIRLGGGGGGGGVRKIRSSNGVLYTHWSERWSLQCELLFVSGQGRVSSETNVFHFAGFCELLRWPLRSSHRSFCYFLTTITIFNELISCRTTCTNFHAENDFYKFCKLQKGINVSLCWRHDVDWWQATICEK